MLAIKRSTKSSSAVRYQWVARLGAGSKRHAFVVLCVSFGLAAKGDVSDIRANGGSSDILGVVLFERPPKNRPIGRQGVLIRCVIPDSVAAHARIRKRDRLLKIDSHAVGSLHDLKKAWRHSNDKAVVEVERQNRPLELPVRHDRKIWDSDAISSYVGDNCPALQVSVWARPQTLRSLSLGEEMVFDLEDTSIDEVLASVSSSLKKLDVVCFGARTEDLECSRVSKEVWSRLVQSVDHHVIFAEIVRTRRKNKALWSEAPCKDVKVASIVAATDNNGEAFLRWHNKYDRVIVGDIVCKEAGRVTEITTGDSEECVVLKYANGAEERRCFPP